MNHKKRICLFEDDIAQDISSISCMPACVTDAFFPAISYPHGEFVAGSLSSTQGATLVFTVDMPNDFYDMTDAPFEDIILGNIFIPDDVDIICLPMLLGNRFELAYKSSSRKLAENISLLVDDMNRDMLWIRRDIYVQLRAAAGRGTHPSMTYSRSRIEAEEENVNAITFAVQLSCQHNAVLPMKKNNSSRAGIDNINIS